VVFNAETMEAFCYPAGRHVEPLEGWTVLKCDWSSARQGSTRHPVPVGASRRDRSGCSSPFAASAYLGGTRRHLPWDRQRLLDEGDRPTPEPRSFHDEPRGSPPWRAQYRASNADQRAWQLALRPKVCHLALHAKLRTIVASKLTEDWSPQLISGWLKIEYPNDESLRVSHETIYRSLFIQARGALKQELIQHLRTKRRIRRSRNASVHGHSQGKIVDAVSIRERPAEAEERAIPGHWEGDLLRGAGNSHVVTLVERSSRFVTLIKVSGKDTGTVVAALSQHVQQLPAALRRSLTWDRGLEMAQHKSFTMATDVQVYFCDRKVPGNAARTKTPTGCCGNTCPRNQICLSSLNRSWTRSLFGSIPGRDKPWDFKLRQINCKPVLHRPLETTGITGMWLFGGWRTLGLWVSPTVDSHRPSHCRKLQKVPAPSARLTANKGTNHLQVKQATRWISKLDARSWTGAARLGLRGNRLAEYSLKFSDPSRTQDTSLLCPVLCPPLD
jgi:IS30 family transposase